jgi:hypothetical protein
MENPSSLGWAIRAAGTLAQSWSLGNAKLCQNHVPCPAFGPRLSTFAGRGGPAGTTYGNKWLGANDSFLMKLFRSLEISFWDREISPPARCAARGLGAKTVASTARSAVDKPNPQPYLCGRRANGDSIHFAAFLAVESRMAKFPLI